MFVQNKPDHKARKIFYSTCCLCFGSFLKILSNCFSFLAAVEVIIHLLMLFYKCLRQASFRLFEHFEHTCYYSRFNSGFCIGWKCILYLLVFIFVRVKQCVSEGSGTLFL